METVLEKYVRRFQLLTGSAPFPWQVRVFEDLLRGQDYWPRVITAPTGAGKTNFMAAWLLALVAEAEARERVSMPRRLVWVVNRRVVVDQATALADKFAQICKEDRELRDFLLRLAGLPADREVDPLAVSTLRGEKADNREWRKDIARPSIIVGTVDMIGSRLLFRGYGDGPASRPQHAALLGHDAFVVNDEAHLTPAFAQLLESVQAMQGKSGLKAFHAIRLTATLSGRERYPESFDEDVRTSSAFQRRYEANKQLNLAPCADRKEVAKRMLELATAEGSKRTIVFLRTPKEVRDFARELEKHASKDRIVVITGTQRGFERDQLVQEEKLKVFLRQKPPQEQHWLIATSAAEVGIDATSDRMISTLDTADHLLQRLGRLNRFGEESESFAHIVFTPPKEKEAELLETLEFLESSPRLAPKELFERSDIPFPAGPKLAPLEDWVVDRWSMTSLRDGMPKVASYLHGLNDGEEPRTALAWREEVAYLGSGAFADIDLEKALQVHRVLAREKVDVPRSEAIRYLDHLLEFQGLGVPGNKALRGAEIPVIVVPAQGRPRAWTLGELMSQREALRDEILGYATVLLGPQFCFLESGMLSSNSKAEATLPDVADISNKGEMERGRFLVRPEGDGFSVHRLASNEGTTVASSDWRDDFENQGWRITYELEKNIGEDPDEIEYLVFAKRPTEGKEKGPREVRLDVHTESVLDHAKRFCLALGFDSYGTNIVEAAAAHDQGKDCALFQNAVGGKAGDHSRSLAKSGRRGKLRLGGFRHELLSMAKAKGAEALTLQLIATHHGEGRPHFELSADGNEELEKCKVMRESQPNRFGALQRQFGPWGLAYLEAVLRCADWLASEEEQAGHE